MDQETDIRFGLALLGGCIRGMKQVSNELNAREPGRYPAVDDARMFDVAMLLAATVLEARPEYVDAKRFGKAADLARDMVRDNLKLVRRQSDALGTPMLLKHIEAVLGPNSDAGLIN